MRNAFELCSYINHKAIATSELFDLILKSEINRIISKSSITIITSSHVLTSFLPNYSPPFILSRLCMQIESVLSLVFVLVSRLLYHQSIAHRRPPRITLVNETNVLFLHNEFWLLVLLLLLFWLIRYFSLLNKTSWPACRW